MAQIQHAFSVPGYAARPAKYGPDWFRLTGSDPRNGGPLAWSDQQGVADGAGLTFRGIAGMDNWFHFPITTPTLLNGHQLRCDQVWVTLGLDQDAFLVAVFAFDRITPILQSGPASRLSQDLSDQLTLGKNLFQVPNAHVVKGAVGISVNVFFEKDSNVHFTGAGVFMTEFS